jgi:hypothetical protein
VHRAHAQASSVASLFDAVGACMSQVGVEQEVKEAALAASALLITNLGNLAAAQVPPLVHTMVERLDNELTRMAALRYANTGRRWCRGKPHVRAGSRRALSACAGAPVVNLGPAVARTLPLLCRLLRQVPSKRAATLPSSSVRRSNRKVCGRRQCGRWTPSCGMHTA